MAASGACGYAVQIVQVTESRRFVLDEQALAGVLLREDTRHLPVVLVSVAGAYRGGKSFLLNFFLRYLTAPQSARDDGSWLYTGDNLEGFSWRSGTKLNTTGIQIWSQPLICNITPTKKVAVLLMDTQGTFDSSSTMADCTNLFALSTLLCSVQIYNLSKIIQEFHLQHLHLFSEYGRLMHDQGHGKAFQSLIFLLRDWQNASEYDFGTDGGNKYLKAQLQIHNQMPEELQVTRRHIASTFENISCFLMPHPGLEFVESEFNGHLHMISAKFIQNVKELVELILKSKNLAPKTIGKTEINGEELYALFKSYMVIFSSGHMPPTNNIVQVTIEANLHATIRELGDQYEAIMERECGTNVPSLSADDVQHLHEQYKNTALAYYSIKKKMGTESNIELYQKKLSKNIDSLAEKFAVVNGKKRQAVIEASENAYKDHIKQYLDADDLICVHPDDLDGIHRRAFIIALNTFDSLVRRISNKKDRDRDSFEMGKTNKYNRLKAQNERSNKRLVDDLRVKYWHYMQPSVLAHLPPFLQRQHEAGLEGVLQHFKELRKCLSEFYASDVYKDMLLEVVNDHYNDIQIMNARQNGIIINEAVTIYNAFVNENWNTRNEHLHPAELEHIHKAAYNAAFQTLLGRRNQQDLSPEDIGIADRMIMKRYSGFKEINAASNNEAVQTAYNVFISTWEEQLRANWYLHIVPLVDMALVDTLFQTSEQAAIEEFYKNRKNRGTQSSDAYYQELMKKIKKHHWTLTWILGVQTIWNFIKSLF